MKSTSHFAMAHLMYASLQKRNIYLNRIAFVYGNIAPDYTPALLVPTHFSKTCSRMTAKILNDLSQTPICSNGRVGAEYSKQLGLLCHFLCDSFCFAHNDDFLVGIKQHAAYENKLDAFLRHNCLKILDINGSQEIKVISDSDDLIADIEASKESYLECGYTLQNDLTFAFEACMSAIVNIVGISKRIPAASTSIELEDFITSLKGFATGESIVFRMFFYKNRNNNIFFLPELMPPIGALS